ncbi:hypothetical protein HG536_0G01230 [Torulaspora globosa]|uniref:HTH APSES-type domain-containing protein n=1 Tax=Torulaspora globosa TaxID=48254 RepID=A0A7G3ZL78_9SACH|nr:uncharacterized protein HG536_0G01230 [Torulaspora globosa]QLL34264.1 hypothetical protein HG536_0G01230 [Torulaspora globosa]
MEIAPSNGSSSESDSSGLLTGFENRTSNGKVLNSRLMTNAGVPDPVVAYKQWQYPGYGGTQHDVSRDAAAAQPVWYYYPPLQTGPVANGYQQQPYYYCNAAASQQQPQPQPQSLPQLQQGSSQYPRPKVYQFPGFQEPHQQQHQSQQPHVQQGPIASPNLSSTQQQFPLRQFTPSPAPYQVSNASMAPLGYPPPQPGYDPTAQLLSPPNAPASLARRPGAPLKQAGRRPVKQRDPLELPQESRMQSYDVTASSGQMTRPRVTTTMWEDEKTLCYQVEANGVSVVRRADNDMINGTKLLNVAKITRGRRDGILKAERIRHVVKIGSMHLKGVWIPFERAQAMAEREKIVDYLYPLFVKDIESVLKQPSSDMPEPLPPPMIPPQPAAMMLPPQQNRQEEDLTNPQPQLSYDLAPAWYGNLSNRPHTSPQSYRNTLSYGQYQNIASSSTTPPSFPAPAPLQPAFHQPLPPTGYQSDFALSNRTHDRGSATSISTSSSNASGPSALSSDPTTNPQSSRRETKADGHTPKNTTPGKLLTGIQPPQPNVDGSEDKIQDDKPKDV